jgi:hypothetical protein
MDVCGSKAKQLNLHLLEFAYNKNPHVSVGVNSFEAIYGQECFTLTFWHIL